MPFCPQCGVDNPAAARYCDQCGAMLIPVNTPAPAPVAASIPVAPLSGSTLISSAPVCPQCGQQAIPGEAFCDNCGAALNAPARPVAPISSVPGPSASPSYPPPQPVTPTQSASPPVQRLTPPAPVPPVSYQPPSALSTPPISTPPTYTAPSIRSSLSPAKLMVASSGAIISLPGTTQVIVGRSDAVSQFFPDIDLTPHGALEQGVGRRHMRIFVSGTQIMLEDLESTNGTLVNGQRLSPHQPQALRNGDQVTVGKLVLQYQE